MFMILCQRDYTLFASAAADDAAAMPPRIERCRADASAAALPPCDADAAH